MKNNRTVHYIVGFLLTVWILAAGKTKASAVEYIPEGPEEYTTEYSVANDREEFAVTEQIMHDLSIEAGDKKKVLLKKESSKLINVTALVYTDEGNLVEQWGINCKFKKFCVESYQSSDPSVVKISKSEGDTYPTISAEAPGSAIVQIIYSYTYEDLKAYYKTAGVVTVKEAPVRDVGLYPTALIRGESVTYEARLSDMTNSFVDESGQYVTETRSPEQVTWSSSSPKTASVDQGTVCGLLQGTVTITLKYKYRFSDGVLTRLDRVKVSVDCYTVEGNLVILQPSVAYDADAAPAINAACEYARDNATDENPYTILFAAGTYNLASATVRVYSNTTLDLQAGCVLRFAGIGGAKGSRPILKLGINGAYDGETDYNTSAKCAGYGGFRNVRIVGGTIESTDNNKSTHVVMAHAANVVFEGVHFTGGAGMHMLEIAAIDGFVMENCVFDDFTGSKDISADPETGRIAHRKISGNYEALQFDVAASAECFGGIYMDGTPMRNIRIEGCIFDGVPRGVGIHTQLLGSYHDTADISYNTFINTTKEAIHLLGFKNCKINYNSIENCGAGIVLRSFADNGTYVTTKIFECSQDYDGEVEYDVNSEIIGNDISITHRGQAKETVGILIYGRNVKKAYKSYRPANRMLWGEIEEDNYCISNVRVEENLIITAGGGIHFSDAWNCVARNNIITGGGYMTKSVYSGIYASEYSRVDEITGNTIIGIQGNGIAVAPSSTVTGTIMDNEIRKVKYCALKLENTDNPLLIINNKFYSKCKEGSVVYIATGEDNENIVELMENTISGVKGKDINGIFMVSGTGILQKNTIAKVKTGIRIDAEKSSYMTQGNQFKSTVKTKKKIM